MTARRIGAAWDAAQISALLSHPAPKGSRAGGAYAGASLGRSTFRVRLDIDRQKLSSALQFWVPAVHRLLNASMAPSTTVSAGSAPRPATCV
jgi:hypothetical protein